MTAPRRRAEARGRRGEWLAALAYLLRGYEIVARRERTPLGEIDLIVRKGRLIALVEVKAHADADASIRAVTPRARRRIEEAGRLFVARRPAFAAFDRRYDIAAVQWPRVTLIRNAWRHGS